MPVKYVFYVIKILEIQTVPLIETVRLIETSQTLRLYWSFNRNLLDFFQTGLLIEQDA